jgi:hypothetical protein
LKDGIITATDGRKRRGNRRVAKSLAIATAVLLGVCACGSGDDSSLPGAALHMRHAAASKDFCDLAAAIRQPAFLGSEGRSVVATYETFDRAVNAATKFVPSELTAKWPAIVQGADNAAKEAVRTNGNLDDPQLRALLTSGDFRTAYDAVDAWVADHC